MATGTADRVTIDEAVFFGTGGGRDLACDVFTPPGGADNAPGVLIIHGGGWREGDRSQLRGYGLRLARAGYVCVASEYRLTPESPWPAQIHDVKTALRWMRANATDLGLNPDRIAVEGNSAGAHLALLIAGTAGVAEFEGEGGNPGVSTDVSVAIGIYGPTDFITSGGGRVLVADQGEDVARAASPITYIDGEFPPTLLIHGNADETVAPEQSELMYRALLCAGVATELHMYAGQPHAFDAEPVFARQCADLMRLFLDRYIAAPVAAG
ncbi:MAG TPA: alpha/beta hydrolase [Dehalococcoidia bacterium]|nr:alpha/beta hydrolase [Dehalococcoidia bacterium]